MPLPNNETSCGQTDIATLGGIFGNCSAEKGGLCRTI